MLDPEFIRAEFIKLLQQRGSGKRMRISPRYKAQLAWKIRHGRNVPIDTQVRMLQRAGIRFEQKEYTHADLVSLAKFVIRTSQVARDFGAEYVIEKWKAQAAK